MFTPDDFEFGKVTNRVTKPLAYPSGASLFAQAAIPLGRPAFRATNYKVLRLSS